MNRWLEESNNSVRIFSLRIIEISNDKWCKGGFKLISKDDFFWQSRTIGRFNYSEGKYNSRN